MPYHVKTPSVINPTIGDVYYKGDNTWSETYADRKIYHMRGKDVSGKNNLTYI